MADANSNRTEPRGDGLDPGMIDLRALLGADPTMAITVAASGAAGARLGIVRDPMPGRGISTYATSGTMPGQLALGAAYPAGGVEIVRGAAAMVAGTTYAVTIAATSADGLESFSATVRFRAT